MAKVHMTIRIDEELKKAAIDMAKDDNRSLGNFIEQLIIAEAQRQHGKPQ
jgi:predicted HicB family RNase H-like nuclease